MPNPASEFASGFTRGLVNVLNQKRQEKVAAQDRQQKNAQAALHFLVESGQLGDIADAGPIADLAFGFGDAAGGKKAKAPKGQADPQQLVSSLLGPALANAKAAGTPGGPFPSAGAATPAMDTFANAPGVASTPPTPGVTQATEGDPAQAGRRTIFGVPVLSREEALTRDVTRKVGAEERTTLARVEMARNRILPMLRSIDPTATLDDALAVIGIDMRRAGGLTGSAARPQSIAGELPDGTPAFAVFRNGRYYDADTDLPIDGFRPRTTTGSASLGIYAERAAKMITNPATGRPFLSANEAARAGMMDAVNAKAAELQKTDAQERREGTGIGAFNSPTTIPQSQTTGVPVGVTGPQVVGQVVPTQDQNNARRTYEVLTGDMQRLLGDGTPANPGLLGVLPSKDDLAGLAPGAVMAARRRLNSYREDIRRLQSVVDSMVNDLARYRGQRGAQTEGDVNRAYNALVQLQTALTDPLGGDTRESARAAIEEARAGLERVARTQTPVVVPNRPATAQPSGSPQKGDFVGNVYTGERRTDPKTGKVYGNVDGRVVELTEHNGVWYQ